MNPEAEMDVEEGLSDDSESDNEQQKQEVNAAKQKIQVNELDYDAHLGLIKILRKNGELHELREAREHFSQIYPMSPDLWMEWLTDEQSICTTDEERVLVMKLFDRGVLDYMSVKIWVEYIMFMMGGGDIDATRSVTARALTAVGIHAAEGILVWQVVSLVEQQFYATIDTENAEAQLEQKKKIKALFTRQARVPLMNVDKEEFLTEAAVWFEESEMKSLRNDLTQSMKKSQANLPFENALISATTEIEKLEAYRKYLDHVCHKDKNPTVLHNLYERCVTELCLNAGIWEEYVRFAAEQFAFAGFVLLPICERSLRNCPWSVSLCELRLRAIKKFSEQSPTDLRTELRLCLDKTIKTGLSSADLVKVWMSYLVILRLSIPKDATDNSPEVTAFRSECQEASASIDKVIEESSNVCEIERFQARVESRILNNPEKARQLFNEVIFRKGNNFKRADIWMEFISQERHNHVYVRKLFRRALERVWDQVELIGTQYKQFEEENGDLESIEDFEKRYIARLLIVQHKRQEDEAKKLPKKTVTEVRRPLSKEHNISTKRKLDDSHMSPVKKFKPDPTTKPQDHGQFVKHDHKNDYRTVFLSNLDYHVGETEILPIFADCGEVEALRITKDFKGRSKGFGYLEFKDLTSVLKALRKDRSPIGTRPMFVSECDTNKSGHVFQYSEKMEKDKLFVRGLPFSMTEATIKELFAKHGRVNSLRLITHRNGFSKGICYIEFANAEAAASALAAMDGQDVDGKILSVMVSDPSKKNQKLLIPDPTIKVEPSKKLSLMPRALVRNNPKPSTPTQIKPDSAKSNNDFRKMLLN